MSGSNVVWVSEGQLNLAKPTLTGSPGEEPDNPTLPDNSGSGEPGEPWVFELAEGGQWFDPPMVERYDYEITDEVSLFTTLILPDETVLDDADDSYDVTVGNTTKSFAPGATVDLIAEFGLSGGASFFSISDIEGPVAAEDPEAFPVYLSFGTHSASFTITPIAIPEPSTPVLLVLGNLILFGRRRACDA